MRAVIFFRKGGYLAEEGKTRSLARAVLGGVGLITAASIGNRLFSLVSAPILTNALGPSPYGVVALLSTVTSLASTGSLLGIDHAYARFFFSGTPDERDSVERFCWRFSAAMLCAASLCAGLGWWAWSFRAGLPPELSPMVAAGVALSVLAVMSSTMRRLRGGYNRIALSTLAAGGVGAAVAVVLALFWRKDAWTLLIGGLAGSAVGIAVNGLPPPGVLARGSGLSPVSRREILRLGLAGAAVAPMYWVMNSADRWLIGIWNGKEALGIYSFATTVGMMGLMLNSAITLTWFPEMTKVYEEAKEEAKEELGRMWARLVGVLLVAWLAVAAAGGDVLRLLSDPRFHPGASCVPWIAGGVLFYGIASLANTGLLLRKDLTPVVGWWVLGAAANVGLNLFLVRRYGGWGAAVSSCVSYALISACVMRSAQSRYRLVLPWGRLAGAGAAALAAGIPMTAPWAEGPAASLALKFPVGLLCGAVMMWIVAPDWIRRIPALASARGASRSRTGGR